MTSAKTAAKTKTKPKDQKEANAVKIAENAFTGAADALGAGIDALFADTGAQYSLIPLDMIEVKAQIRETFEDEVRTIRFNDGDSGGFAPTFKQGAVSS